MFREQIYMRSLQRAEARGDATQWMRSHALSQSCRHCVESGLYQDRNDPEALLAVCREVADIFGVNRLNWVVANSIAEHEKASFSQDNLLWADAFEFPDDPEPLLEQYALDCAPALIDALATQARAYGHSLGYFDPSHCEPQGAESLDYTGRVLALNPLYLPETCDPKAQLFLAEGGYGCNPRLVGKTVTGRHLVDGTQAPASRTYNRRDFFGAVREELLPAWVTAVGQDIENVGQSL